MNNKAWLRRWFVKATWGGSISDELRCIYLPTELLKKLSLKTGSEVLFKMGLGRTNARIMHLSSNSQSQSVIFLSPDLSDIYQIPAGQSITLCYNKQLNLVSAGPLIGLFTVRNIFPDTEYGSQEPLLTALSNSSNNISGFVFVFCPEDINWQTSTVKALVPHFDREKGESCWQPLTVPLPDVVYDRIPSRSIEARPEVQEARNRLISQPGLVYFNPKFLDKWEIHAALSGISDVAAYLPPTRLMTGLDDIKDALKEHGSVFLKPTSGSLGRRIIKLMAADGHFKYIYRSRNRETFRGSSTDFNLVFNQLKPLMGSRTYVIQKDLDLSLFENCTFDIRVLSQKDMFGNWRRTKIYARVAAPDSFLANLSDGARTVPLRIILEDVFGENFLDKNGLGERIRVAVSKIPPAVEKATGMIWGELGLDLGIDKNGRVWLIEVNSKPFRTLVSASGSMSNIQRSLLRPLEFAKFLAGFYRHSPAELIINT